MRQAIRNRKTGRVYEVTSCRDYGTVVVFFTNALLKDGTQARAHGTKIIYSRENNRLAGQYEGVLI